MSHDLDPKVHLSLSMRALGINNQEVTGAEVDGKGQLIVHWERGLARETSICFVTTDRAQIAHDVLALRCNFT